jgi:hypothetical protein
MSVYILVLNGKMATAIRKGSPLTAPIRAHRQDTNWTPMEKRLDATEGP